jgi:hypothetical protein
MQNLHSFSFVYLKYGGEVKKGIFNALILRPNLPLTMDGLRLPFDMYDSKLSLCVMGPSLIGKEFLTFVVS